MIERIKKEKSDDPLPFPIYFWTVVSLSLLGLAVSFYLSISHYRVYTDIGYRSFCAITRAINCDTVSQSRYSFLLGLPVPIWGVIGYAFLLLLLFFAGRKRADNKRLWALLFFTTLIYSAYSIVLSLISTFYIKSYCLLCIATYGINFLLLFYFWLIRKRFDQHGLIQGLKQDFSYLWVIKKQIIPIFSSLLFCIIILHLFFPRYWQLTPPSISTDISNGITKEGHPWIGAKTPKLIITEFADYQCFQCKKMHFFLRDLIAKYPENIRLVHRHFPLDHKVNPIVKEAFHVGSGAMALIAIYAVSEGKFWEMNDALFQIAGQKSVFNTRELAKKVGIDIAGPSIAMKDPNIQLRLQLDIMEGLKLGITATPAFVIDGKVFLGQLPPEIIKKAIE